MKTIFLIILAFFYITYARDYSVNNAIKCLEKKQMDVFSIEEINGIIYVVGTFNFDKDVCSLKNRRKSSIYEYKKNCVLQEMDYLRNLLYNDRKGLYGAIQNKKKDSIIVYEKNTVLWACPQRLPKYFIKIHVLDKNLLVIDSKDSLWLLNNKCQWTLFEQNVGLPFFHSVGKNSRFLSYYLGKQRNSYIVVFDSLLNNYWGTTLSFPTNVSTRDIACGYDFFENPDDTDQNKWFVKCVKWTENLFEDFSLSHRVNVLDHRCPIAEHLFPCGNWICSQNYETKKIKILVKE